ncbi:DUF4845 domain-containing protein [Legionella longbeachae]|uniref:Transmembrane protein n=1 Tax=Legionella longbeachae serogroup 1 (strain NSW150) TaxID=661367 RepID=D3HRV8_LEGLN|nr:DUF4845 domain-containing protein [Legionella longbeachae]VEE02141.1 transmembrane protein [Legionella oakridgensis]HBD7396614.1 DUF4845 domain-containing protein [Legionella pneumophila]ARB91559.1 DUF4845 domain-containing protein [Legionella longbeachae]ARM35295.1 DUF4845 domain-containing protein [Legionella longbeachae]EEZ95235.1 conserved hypothetical protein [Legionella longbeachae D-4968]
MNKQQGMTFIGTILTIVAIVMAATVIMRVIPVYLQYYSIIRSINDLNSIPASNFTGDSMQDINELKSALDKHLDINGIKSLNENQLTIEPLGANKFMVRLKYKVIKPLIYNVSLLFDFNHTEEVVAGSEN